MAFVMMASTAATPGCGSPHQSPTPGPSVHDLVVQARKFDLAGQESEAIRTYRQALAIDPNSYDAHYGIGRAFDLAGEYDAAREHFTRPLDVALPGDKDQTQRMRAISWTFVGNVPAAEADFKAVYDRQIASGNFGAAGEEANELGRLYLESGNLTTAESWYRTGHEVAARVADLADWQVNLDDLRWAHAQARIAARRGLAEEAQRQSAVVEALLAKGGNDDQKIAYAYLLGYVAFYLGHYADASAALTTADQKDPAVLLLRGEAAEKLGKNSEAREYYRRVVQSTAHSINSAFARPVAERRLAAADGSSASHASPARS